MAKKTAEIIRELRIKKGLTTQQLADKIGKNRTTVWRYENGDIEEMPYTVLIPIAKALNVSPVELLGFDDNYYTDPLNELNDYVKENLFADYEIEQLFDYAKYLVSKRDR